MKLLKQLSKSGFATIILASSLVQTACAHHSVSSPTINRSIEVCNRESCAFAPYSPKSARDGYSYDEMYVQCGMSSCSIPRGNFFSENELQNNGKNICAEIILSPKNGVIPRYALRQYFFLQSRDGGYPYRCDRRL